MLIVHMYHMQHISSEVSWLGGATVARLTPDQKVACSNHVRVIHLFIYMYFHVFQFLIYVFSTHPPQSSFLSVFLFVFLLLFSSVYLKSTSDLFTGINNYLAGVIGSICLLPVQDGCGMATADHHVVVHDFLNLPPPLQIVSCLRISR